MPVVMEERSVRFAFITTRAEKQTEDLQPRDRSKVVGVLGQPVRRDRCKKMNSCDRYWRARITDDLRVTFCFVDGQACVVHVGAHHESDRFVDHANGTFLPEFKPLKESLVMKKNFVIRNTKMEEPDKQIPAADWLNLMERGIKGLVDHLLIDELEAIRELSTDQINDVRHQVDGQADSITKLTGRVNDLANAVQQGKAEQANHASELTKLGIAARSEAKRQGEEISQRLAKVTQEHDQQIATIGQKLTRVAGLSEERLAALAQAGEAHERSCDQLGEDIARLGQQFADAREATQTLTGRVAQIESGLENLGKAMTTIAQQHNATIVALRELKRANEEREAAAACRTWKARLQRITGPVRAWFTKAKAEA